MHRRQTLSPFFHSRQCQYFHCAVWISGRRSTISTGCTPNHTMWAAKLPNKMVVTIRLIHPSHGGAYMVEGRSTIRFRLACRCTRALHLHTLPRIVTVRCTFLFSCVSGFRVAPILLSCYLHYHVFHSAAYMVSCIPWQTHLVYGLVTLSADAPRCSIMFHSY